MINKISEYAINQVLNKNVTKKIVIYPGRFQPFHKAHYKIYSNLIKQFGKQNVYIFTSDVTEEDKSPFNFKEKQKIMQLMFEIPKQKIIQTNNMYSISGNYQFFKKFDDLTTVVIFAIGKKDRGRISTQGTNFEQYSKKTRSLPYIKKRYVYYIQTQKIKYKDDILSGTLIRKLFSSNKLSINQKKKVFIDLYSNLNEQVFDLFLKRMSVKLLNDQKKTIEEKQVQKNSLLWQDDVYKMILKCAFPISNKIFTKLNKNKIIRAYHYTSQNYVDFVINHQKTNNALSCTTKWSDAIFEQGIGNKNTSMAFILQGNLLVTHYHDIMTMPDNSGRRWIDYSRIMYVFDDYVRWVWQNQLFQLFKKYGLAQKIVPTKFSDTTITKYSKQNLNIKIQYKQQFIRQFFEIYKKFIPFAEKRYDSFKNKNIEDPNGYLYDQTILTHYKIVACFFRDIDFKPEYKNKIIDKFAKLHIPLFLESKDSLGLFIDGFNK